MHVCVRAKERKREKVRQIKRQSVNFAGFVEFCIQAISCTVTFVHYDKNTVKRCEIN